MRGSIEQKAALGEGITKHEPPDVLARNLGEYSGTAPPQRLSAHRHGRSSRRTFCRVSFFTGEVPLVTKIAISRKSKGPDVDHA